MGENESKTGPHHSDAERRLPIASPEEHLQQLVDTALDAVVTCDTSSRITVWNAGAEQLFGWSAGEAIGNTLTETIIPSEYHEAHERGMAHYLKSGEGPVLGQRIEITARKKSGATIPVELSINPIRTSEGLGFSAFIRDITDRLEAEKRIREGEERLQLVIDSADEGIWDYQFDETGAVVESFIAERTKELLGDQALLIPPDRKLPFAEEREAISRAWGLHWTGVEEAFFFEYRVRGENDGEPTWLREHGTIVKRDDEGRPLRAVGTITDISARKKLQRTLLAAQKGEALGHVAGGFAHDLNNVLSIIRGHASILKHDTSLPGSVIESLEDIDLAVDRARTLIQNMLQLGRPSKGQRQSTPVNALVAETLELIRPAMPRSIQLTSIRELSDSDAVYLNSEQLQQAFLNLLLNARDSMENGGELTVRTERITDVKGNPRCVIRIIDSGCGIPEENLDAVFEPFFTTKGKEGTGLGLATVKNFIEDSAGRISIRSEPGVGTTIEIELPMLAPGRSDTDVDSRSAGRNVQNKSICSMDSSILLAEDHDMLRPMLTSSLIQAGHEVRAAHSAEKAREEGLRARPDLMVMDIDLPGGSGSTVADEIRAHWEGDIPVIFITGNSNHEVIETKSTKLLRKPFDIAHLIESVSTMLRANE